MLSLARAFIAKPKLLFLDEPSLGLAPIIVEKLIDCLEMLNKVEDVTILLVEQNKNVGLSISERVYLLSAGEIVHQGSKEELVSSEEI